MFKNMEGLDEGNDLNRTLNVANCGKLEVIFKPASLFKSAGIPS